MNRFDDDDEPGGSEYGGEGVALAAFIVFVGTLAAWKMWDLLMPFLAFIVKAFAYG